MSLLQRSVQAALRQVRGTYGIAVICKDEPDTLVVARKGSPLIIGVGKDEYIVASDSSAIVEHTASVIYLNDNEMAVLHPDSFRTSTIDDVEINPIISQLENKIEAYELGNYDHYMLKEIFEQPTAINNCLRGRAERKEGRIVLGGLTEHARELLQAKRIILTAQGTAWHAGLLGDYLLEDLAKIVTGMHIRFGVPLSKSHRRGRDGADRHQPVRRNSRYAGGPSRRQGKRRAVHGDRQRRSAAPSPANPAAASIFTPARKSASPAPRHSPANSSC